MIPTQGTATTASTGGTAINIEWVLLSLLAAGFAYLAFGGEAAVVAGVVAVPMLVLVSLHGISM